MIDMPSLWPSIIFLSEEPPNSNSITGPSMQPVFAASRHGKEVNAAKKSRRRTFLMKAKVAGKEGARRSRLTHFREDKPVTPPRDARAVTFQRLSTVAQCVSAFPVTLQAFSLLHPHHTQLTFLHCYDLADWNASHHSRPIPMLSVPVPPRGEVRRDDLALDFPNGLMVAASIDVDGRRSLLGPRLRATFWVTALDLALGSPP
jgi:hypothetical protein